MLENLSFKELYTKQVNFQKKVLALQEYNEDEWNFETAEEIISRINLPKDSTHWFSYHMQAMIEELGEVLKADKRWKTHRNERFEPEEKAKELADVFITFLNLCIFSGITNDVALDAAAAKIDENFRKLEESESKK